VFTTRRITLILVLFSALLSSCTYYGSMRYARRLNLNEAKFNPNFIRDTLYRSATYNPADPIINNWAGKPLTEWKRKQGTNVTRIILAKLSLGKDVKAVNDYLLTCLPYGTAGTHWAFNPKGDYDFSEIGLAAILSRYANDTNLLYPATARHIAYTALLERGNKRKTAMPGTAGVFRDTENHILMKEVTRYLNNQWICEHDNCLPVYNNATNGMDKWMIAHLDEMNRIGFFEFNAKPYSGYTFAALLILHAYAHNDTVALKTQQLIDKGNAMFAHAQYDYKFAGPFRRRWEHITDTLINEHPQLSLLSSWVNMNKGVTDISLQYGQHQQVMARLLPYRITDSLAHFVEHPNVYFVKAGHGGNSSPEIYYAGKDYLLSAGGVKRGPVSQMVPMPIVLLTKNNSADLHHYLRIPGNKNPKKRNNTGVYKNLAVANSKVELLPEGLAECIVYVNTNWQFLKMPHTELTVAVYDADNFGLIIAFEGEVRVNDLFIQLNSMNSDDKLIRHQITLPDNTILTYNVNSSQSKWVIKTINGVKQERRFNRWKAWEEL
jgi:hypothetical protein